jgi:histidine triad (HIT) family protein
MPTEADCLFCGIVAGRIPADVVHQDDQVLAFRDIDPKAPVHVLVIPKRHVASLADAEQADQGLLGTLLLTAAEVARAEGVADAGYRTVINTGDDGGQTVGHLHVHLLAGRPMRWPPG